jgi:hypothetical protein
VQITHQLRSFYFGRIDFRFGRFKKALFDQLFYLFLIACQVKEINKNSKIVMIVIGTCEDAYLLATGPGTVRYEIARFDGI